MPTTKTELWRSLEKDWRPLLSFKNETIIREKKDKSSFSEAILLWNGWGDDQKKKSGIGNLAKGLHIQAWRWNAWQIFGRFQGQLCTCTEFATCDNIYPPKRIQVGLFYLWVRNLHIWCSRVHKNKTRSAIPTPLGSFWWCPEKPHETCPWNTSEPDQKAPPVTSEGQQSAQTQIWPRFSYPHILGMKLLLMLR